MTDLNERLRGIDRLSPPDLWAAARARALDAGRPTANTSARRRFVVIAASLAIGLAAVAVVAMAFRAKPDGVPVTPGPSVVENGDIWVKLGGGEGGTAIIRVDPEHVPNPEAMWTDVAGVFGGARVAPELVADDYAFSPDGSRVAFSGQAEPGSGVPVELFVMNADGTELHQLTHDGAYAGFPAWSPDGTTIAYARYTGTDYIPGCLGFSICPTDLYLIAAGGSTPSPLVTSPESETTPTWSPDGSRIAYAEIGEGGSGVIVTVETDGSDRIELSPGGAVSFPSWSPDGKLILFLRSQDGTNHVWTVTPDDSGHHDVVDTRTDTNFGRPLWSPEGDAIAFARPYAGVVSVWLTDPAGDRSPERIAGWPGFDGAPIAWRPVRVSSDSVTVLVSTSGPSGDDALLSGTLTTDSGCVAVGEPGSSVYVVWPTGYSLIHDGEEVWLADDSGNLVAAIGDKVQMGGGITNLAHAEPQVQGGIPAACEVGGPDAYWFAGRPEVVWSSSSAPSDTGAIHLPGIDTYRVCRVLSMPGDFGDAGDEVVVFEEERVPDAGCSGSEGFQHVAVLRDGQVTSLSRRLTDIDPEAWRVWPYATPDLDGDGTDEIAVAAAADPSTTARVWFLRVATDLYSGGLIPVVSIVNGAGPFQFPIDAPSSGEVVGDSGIYCEERDGALQVVTWGIFRGDHLGVVETRWQLTGGLIRLVAQSRERVIEGEDFGPLLNEDLCGSPVSLLDSYP